ncbi:ubiquitin-related domain-containing protein [Dichotomopilus funicola]|uniref:Ubiquitin-related domain-containing protein n=1 Tax=Dichotomopilus funicola TaxID=1934379 RepID=A0AAN6UXK8_9PEZI|nr:ubiquitin-related domain-containing protein [Dichotomopilus funicola]
MAEPTPKIDDGEATNESTAQQPTATVPAVDADEGKEKTEYKTTIEQPAAESSVAVADSDLKGKEKDETPKPREGDSLSIGPTEPPAPVPEADANTVEAPVCAITLLLPTGARHPYRIDEKYLAKRSVEMPDVTESGVRDPFSISIYKLKELILREWREEWEGKPASPSSIRLIHFGKLLDDKEQLKKYQFSHDSPNILHMSVRPPEMMEEEETSKSKSHGREGRNRDGGNGCCVIL